MSRGTALIANRARKHRFVVLLLAMVASGVLLVLAAKVGAATAPTVTSVSPSSGPTAGGNSVTITGTDLSGASEVDFGPGNAVMAPTFSPDGTITVNAPPGTAGTVDVQVTTPDGTSPANPPADQYTYVPPPPTVTGVSPSSGPTGGGNSVKITGTDLSGASEVDFGPGNAVTSPTVSPDGTITVTAPPGTAGTVDVQVKTPGGTSAANPPADQYSYVPPPSVSGVSPSSGPQAGGTNVTITGSGFTGSTGVSFGANPASNVTVVSDTEITATSPAGTGTVDVTVTGGPNGSSPTNQADQYTYVPPPSVSGVSPSSGPQAGGTNVTITGSGFTGSTGVSFGANPASNVTVVSDTEITATSPAGTGTVDVTVTGGPNGSSPTNPPADQYTYVAPPSVTSISPTSGTAGGGTTVTINGSGFTNASVQFGGKAATITHASATQLVVLAPAGSPGTVTVRVTTPFGTATAPTGFTYTPVNTPPPTTAPRVAASKPSPSDSHTASVTGQVNPEGLATTAYYAYGLDARYQQFGITTYDHASPKTQVGSDFANHPLPGTLTGLLPNALYHVRLVASNRAGQTIGPDQTFTTPAAAAPPPPQVGKNENLRPSSGTVFVLERGNLVPLTENTQLPSGTVIDALNGSISLVAATGKKGRTYTGTFGGAIFKITQIAAGANKGLTILSIVEGAFPGAPSYRSCSTNASRAASAHAALGSRVLQTLHSRSRGRFRTRGRYAAGTVRGTQWTTSDRCDGTLIAAQVHAVQVADFVRHITIPVHAGHHYLALAHPPKAKKKKKHK